MHDPKGDVHWHIPGRKRPIAYSPKAVSDLIVVLSESGGTVREVYDSINYDQDAKSILKKYIDKGFGDTIARELFR